MRKRNVFLLGMTVMVMILAMMVVGCGQMGGTIVIENDSPNVWAVAISSSSTRPDDTTNIRPGQTYEMSFAFDGTYYAFGNYTDGWRRKTVSLSGGETVTLKSGDF